MSDRVDETPDSPHCGTGSMTPAAVCGAAEESPSMRDQTWLSPAPSTVLPLCATVPLDLLSSEQQ